MLDDKNSNENTIEFDLDDERYQGLENLVNTHRNLKYNEGKTPVTPSPEGQFPPKAPRYPHTPVTQDYRNGATFPDKNARSGQPHHPHTPVSPAKSDYPKGFKVPKKYKSNRRLSKTKRKLPKALTLLLAAGLAIGGFKVVTLGIEHFQDNSRNESLANSQQNLEDMVHRETALGEVSTYQVQNNDLQILNADLNNLLERYEQNPSLVNESEIANLLQNCYLEGRDIVFAKVADAYNAYSNENDEYPKTIDAKNLIYRIDDDMNPPYYIANRSDKVNNPNGTAVASQNSILSDFIKKQLKINDLYTSNPFEENSAHLREGVSASQALDLLKEGVNDINEMATSNLHYEKSLLGNPSLVIDEYQRESDTPSIENVSTSNVNVTHDLDDDER